MTRDSLPDQAKKINAAYCTADRAAREAGRALRKAKGQLGWQEWGEWLTQNCARVPQDAADHCMELAAERRKASNPRTIVPLNQPTVICGWCAHLRAGRGDPPKHVSGPKNGEHVVHGICTDCDKALSGRLEALRQVETKAHGHTAEALAAYHASDWSLACAKLKTAYLNVDQALKSVRELSHLENVVLRNLLGNVSEQAHEALEGLSRLTTELVLLASEIDAESVARVQSVAQREVKAQAAVFAPGNRGKGKVAAHTPREFCPPARWTFKCSRGQDTGLGGFEEFECTVKVLGEDRQFTFDGVRIKQSFSGPDGIGPFVLERVYTKDGDPNHQNFLRAAQVTTSGERSGSTESGLLHWQVKDRGAGFEISFYRSASLAQGDLVARAEGVSIRTPFQATERNASGLTVNWASGIQPQDGATGTLDCNFFVVENAGGVPDQFVIETSVVSEGLIQKLLAEQVGGHLNSKPAGQETIPDDFLRAGNPVSLLES